MKGLCAFLFAFLLWAPLPQWAVGPADIIYMTEDYPPENYLENGQLKGYAVDILKAIWRRMGVPEQPIQVYPWSRGYALLESQPNRMLFAMARTPEREEHFQWVGPIFSAKSTLIALADSPIAPKSLDEAKSLRIGVMRDDIGQEMLEEAGFDVEALVKVGSLDQLMKMLRSGRIDLISAHEPSLREATTKDPSLALNYRVVLHVGEFQVWYAFSRGTDPALVGRFQQALEAIDGERRAIISRYNRFE